MSRRLTFVPAALLLLAGCAGPHAAVEPAPKLVVLLAIDQLRPDRLSDEQPGGLGRLRREGRVFTDAALAHAFTETCPGHATMLTGRHPSGIGIPGNSYTDPETFEAWYCVEDRRPDASILTRPGKPSDGRSPRVMEAGGLGDWMKVQHPGARVFSVSGKDRSAITTAGRHGDAAYWLARGETPGFVTSRYYRKALPAWVETWNRDEVLAGVPARWEYLAQTVADSAGGIRADDYAHESPAFGRAQPHPVLQAPVGIERMPERMRHPAERIYITPFADEITLAFAKELVERENLGGGQQVDLLVVALSATDLVGHFYGPESWESRDALTRLDLDLGDFLEFLEERVGKRRVLVALTADHGVLPLPEWILEQGRSRCPVAGGRVDPKPIVADLNAELSERFGGDAATAWFKLASSRLSLNRKHVAAMGTDPAEVIELARARLESEAGIARAWTRDEVLSGAGPEPMATLYRNSWNQRTGDIAIQVAEDCLLAGLRIATSHGSPYVYDRAVPLIFWGPGVEPGRIQGPAATVDIAPTLARLLGIPMPDDLDGRPLPLE